MNGGESDVKWKLIFFFNPPTIVRGLIFVWNFVIF